MYFYCMNIQNKSNLVSQGSVLGPLLFNLYINDMVTSVDCRLMPYAADAELVVCDRSLGVVERQLSSSLNSLQH